MEEKTNPLFSEQEDAGSIQDFVKVSIFGNTLNHDFEYGWRSLGRETKLLFYDKITLKSFFFSNKKKKILCMIFAKGAKWRTSSTS